MTRRIRLTDRQIASRHEIMVPDDAMVDDIAGVIMMHSPVGHGGLLTPRTVECTACSARFEDMRGFARHVASIVGTRLSTELWLRIVDGMEGGDGRGNQENRRCSGRIGSSDDVACGMLVEG